MKKFIIICSVLLISSSAFAAEMVSIIDLISNPQSHNGNEVVITGYLALDFEGRAIYLSKSDYENSITKNGLWCVINLVKYKKYNHKYVSIEGSFNAKSKGHLGLWSGEIKDVKRVWETERPK